MVCNHIRLLAAVAVLAIPGLPAVTSMSHAADVSISPVAKPKSPEPPAVQKPKLPASEEKPAEAPAETPYKKVIDVFTGDTTIAGEKVSFPAENPGIKSLIVTMEPGEKTAWHQHGTPLYAYILEGDLTVTYEGIGERHYKPGDGFLEAMHVTHQGHNTGTTPVRILAVFLTGDGDKPTIPEKAPSGSQ